MVHGLTRSVPKGTDPAAFIERNTQLLDCPLVPEIKLHLASEIVPIWQLTEEELAKQGVPPPFWAFAWAGGQALSRYILDHPERVRGKSVLDFAAGSGIVAIAAGMAGASSVLAADIDPFSVAACRLNATANGIDIDATSDNLLTDESMRWDVILAGDICYEQPLASQVEDWLSRHAANGTTVLIGDPGRTYLPKENMEKLISYAVKTTRELEDMDVRNTTVWQLEAKRL